MPDHRRFTLLDRYLTQLNLALTATAGPPPATRRTNPATAHPQAALDEAQRQHAAGLMRINHAGEVCAQALYAAQALTARSAQVRQAMQQAADEELDHLSWCAERLAELNSQPSRLGPLWYAGSFALGSVAGLMGDRWNLGFLQETERQVEAHLANHLDRLPAADSRSRAIIEQMKQDEAQHAEMAKNAGAAKLPDPLPRLMAVTASLMKALAYRL